MTRKSRPQLLTIAPISGLLSTSTSWLHLYTGRPTRMFLPTLQHERRLLGQLHPSSEVVRVQECFDVLQRMSGYGGDLRNLVAG